MRPAIYLLLFLFQASSLLAQEGQNNKETHRISIRKTTEIIQLDGRLDEAVWQSAEMATNFWQKWPDFVPNADPQTEVRLTYDGEFLYAGIRCWDAPDYIIQTLKRDQQYWGSDGVAILLDPLNQKINGFFFGSNPLGVQTEALVSGNGGGANMNFDWNNKWFCKTQQHSDHWTVEMAIPFKTLRYDATQLEWGVNFIRNNIQNNQYHTWTPIAQQFEGIDPAFAGLMEWDNPPGKNKSNIALIPYVTGSYADDYDEKDLSQWSGNVGLDAKIAVSSALNLDVTVNPDFSQVEVDQQVTNLDRFSIFFPERRTFFLENSDLFTQFGIPPIRPFFSRRIGLEDGKTVPILYGLRLTGNLTDKLRIGLMNMQTKGNELGQNYTAVAFQQNVLKRSFFKGLFLNRQGVDGTDIKARDYNRNVGGEFSFVSANGKWNFWLKYHQAFKQEVKNERYFGSYGVNYKGRSFSFLQDFANVGTNYFADVGFVARLENYDAERDTTIRMGFNLSYTDMRYRFFGGEKDKWIRQDIGFENFIAINSDGKLNEWNKQLRYFIDFKNRTNLRFRANHVAINLRYPISFVDDSDPLPAKYYSTWHGSVEFDSDRRKPFSYLLFAQYGTFYNGTRTVFRGEIRYRIQPWGNFAINFEHNELRFPDPYGKASLLLLGPRIEVNFSKDLFWTTFLQYNTQADNFNINSRLQWRFSPMSDLFLVYTDNYATDILAPKNRAIILKANYWLNL